MWLKCSLKIRRNKNEKKLCEFLNVWALLNQLGLEGGDGWPRSLNMKVWLYIHSLKLCNFWENWYSQNKLKKNCLTYFLKKLKEIIRNWYLTIVELLKTCLSKFCDYAPSHSFDTFVIFFFCKKLIQWKWLEKWL